MASLSSLSSVLRRVRPSTFRSSFSSSGTTHHTAVLTSASAPGRQPPSRTFAGGAVHPEGDLIKLSGRQYEIALLGNFPDSPTVQPFGTISRPSLIYSGKKSRIVGCIGGGQYAHRLQWFQLKEGKKHVCSQCGQVFKLVTDNNYEEVKDLVDQRTREHYDYFKTLALEANKVAPDGPVAVLQDVGPDTKY